MFENYLQISSSTGSCYGHGHFSLCYFNSIVAVLLYSLFCLLSYSFIFNGYNNYMNFYLFALAHKRKKPAADNAVICCLFTCTACTVFLL